MKSIHSIFLALCILACQTTHAIEPQVSAGRYQNLAVTSDGEVYAWSGANPPTIVKGMRPIVAVAAGVHHNVALAENGFIYEWGNSPYQGLQYFIEHPSLDACEKARAASPRTGQDPDPCAKEEKEREESAKLEKPMRIPGVLPTKAVAVADGVTVILARNGEVYCWSHDQLPQRIPGLENIKSISLGAAHGVALREDGAVLTWGSNDNGELGHPAANPQDQKAAICANFNVQVAMEHAVAIGTGVSSSFALQPNGAIWGWGMNTFHRTATPPSYDAPRRIGTMSAAAELVGGVQHLMARTADGKVFAWGRNSNFAIAQDDSKPIVANPVDLAPLDNVAQLSSYDRTIALTRDGYLCAWGNNANGEALWDSKLHAIPAPTPIVLADHTTPFNLYTGKQAHAEAAHICGVENWHDRYTAWLDADRLQNKK